MAVTSNYIYWTTANQGTATNIARANLDGTGVNTSFITGARNPCGVAVNASYIYWVGDVGGDLGAGKDRWHRREPELCKRRVSRVRSLGQQQLHLLVELSDRRDRACQPGRNRCEP